MRTLKGKYSIANPKKYKGDPTNIIYRSSWERILMVKWDTSSNVLEWSSEDIIIPYRSPATGRVHRYFPDFYVKILKEDGSMEKLIIEIKPYKEVVPPPQPKRVTPAFMKKALTWEINNAKWEAARAWCDKYGYRFVILSEKEISRFKK